MNQEQVRADERAQVAAMLQSWADACRRRDGHMSDYEQGYMRAFQKAARLVSGDEE